MARKRLISVGAVIVILTVAIAFVVSSSGEEGAEPAAAIIDVTAASQLPTQEASTAATAPSAATPQTSTAIPPSASGTQLAPPTASPEPPTAPPTASPEPPTTGVESGTELVPSGCIVASTPGMVIENVIIRRCGDIGIDVTADNVTIRNVVLEGNSTNVRFEQVRGGLLESSTLRNPAGNPAADAYAQQVSIDKSSNITVRNNVMTCERGSFGDCGQEDAVGIAWSSNVLVEANTITGGNSDSGCGVLVDGGSSRAQIRHNLIRDQSNCGIGVAAGSDHVVDANDVAVYGNVGIYVWNQYDEICARISITNNIVAGVAPFWDGENCMQLTLLGNNFEA